MRSGSTLSYPRTSSISLVQTISITLGILLHLPLLSSFPLSFPVLCLHVREWHVAVRYFIAKYSAYMVLVSVFLCGLGEADVISLGYLGFSLLVLFMGNRYLTLRLPPSLLSPLSSPHPLLLPHFSPLILSRFTQSWSRLWEIGRAYAIGSLTLYVCH